MYIAFCFVVPQPLACNSDRLREVNIFHSLYHNKTQLAPMLLKYDMRDRQSCTKRVIEKLKRVVQRARQATVGEMSGKEKKEQKVEMKKKKNKKGETGGGMGGRINFTTNAKE